MYPVVILSALPEVTSLTTNKSTYAPGESGTLSWTSRNAQRCTRVLASEARDPANGSTAFNVSPSPGEQTFSIYCYAGPNVPGISGTGPHPENPYAIRRVTVTIQ